MIAEKIRSELPVVEAQKLLAALAMKRNVASESEIYNRLKVRTRDNEKRRGEA